MHPVDRSHNPQSGSAAFVTKFIDRYPKIQYKIIDGNPMVIKSELLGRGPDSGYLGRSVWLIRAADHAVAAHQKTRAGLKPHPHPHPAPPSIM